MTDQDQAQQVYKAAVLCAKAEFDVLDLRLKELQYRVGKLRQVINAGSALIGEAVEDKYGYGPPGPVKGTRPGK